MSSTLYRVSYEKVIDLFDDEVDAVIGVGQYLDDPTEEQFIVLDYEDTDPDIVALVNDFEAKVRPEVFEVVRRLANNHDTFVVC